MIPNTSRYDTMTYNRCGRSGIHLPAISLGLWHNFGGVDTYENAKNMVGAAFDLGITHFDLANNYGPPAGSAEENFGKILSRELSSYRDELLISTKAGYDMWPGPYGDWGSRKYLLASLDQSLKRMGLEYVDIFYHHRIDPNTPLEETMGALDQAVRQGKALYAGVSSYGPPEITKAAKILKDLGTPCLINQPNYNMFARWIENGLTDVLEEEGIGSIVFCPLAQGQLTSKYLKGIPDGSRAAKSGTHLSADAITPEKVAKLVKLNEIAARRSQTLAQMALMWDLRLPAVTSVLIGASSPEQIKENVNALENQEFTTSELEEIEAVLKD